MITQEEHQVLYSRQLEHYTQRPRKELKEDLNKIYPFEQGFVITEDEIPMSPNIPSKKRYEKKLEEALATDPSAELRQFVEPHQIKYSVRSNSKSKYKGLETNFQILQKAVDVVLQKLKISDENYQQYKEYAKEKIAKLNEEETEERRKLQVVINNIDAQRLKLLDSGFDKRDWTPEQKERYQEKLAEYDRQIDYIDEELQNLKQDGRNRVREFEIILNFFVNAYDYYQRATYVQKKKICSILFLNAIVYKKNKVRIVVRP
jgi:hypothetical protein